jgi:PKD repeat protein
MKMQFRRLVLLRKKFVVPAVNNSKLPVITPSQLNILQLSKKAIPYYYDLQTGTPTLLQTWDYDKWVAKKETQNLSYHASGFSGAPDFVKNPLQYDLDGYDFLRIEGIVGKPFIPVMSNLQTQIRENRLPIEVIALRTGVFDDELSLTFATETDIRCMEISYDIARRSWEATIGKTIEWLDDHKTKTHEFVDPSKLKQFFSLMAQGKKFMVDDFSDFVEDWDDFIVVFEAIEEVATQIRLDLENILGGKSHPFVEELIDHLDEVILSALKGPFRALYQEYQAKVTEGYQKLFLSHYLEHHPGISHKAGVTLGGTFIIVYHRPVKAKEDKKTTTGKKKQVKTKKKLMGKVVADGKPLPGAMLKLKDQSWSAFTDSSGNFMIPLKVLPVTIVVQAIGYGKKEIAISSDKPIEIDFTPKAGSLVDQIEEDFIIADFFLPYICCSDGSCMQMVVKEAEKVNVPPVAKAGSDLTITLPSNSVTLDGTTSFDPDGTIQNYEWTKASGPAQLAIEDPGAAITLVKDLIVGSYEFNLKVTDNQGATSTDTVKITVNPQPEPNKPPVADAGPDMQIILPVNTVTLDGKNSTDPEGKLVKYAWIMKSGVGLPDIVTPDQVSTVVKGLQKGDYEFELTVTDHEGLTDSDLVTIKVTAENKPPIADAGINQQIPIGAVTVLDGSLSKDPDGTIKIYSWKFTGGPAGVNIDKADSETTQVSGFKLPGNYTFQLTVTDDENASDDDSTVITVFAEVENKPPVANAGPDQNIFLPANAVLLDGSGSTDDDGQIVKFDWVQVQGPGIANIEKPGEPVTAVQKLVAGRYIFELTVVDDDGAMAKDTVLINVQQEGVAQKTCLAIGTIPTQFLNLPAVDSANFTKYRSLLQITYQELEAFFAQLGANATKPLADQMKFFLSFDFEGVIGSWLERLNNIILEFEVFRVLALETYRLLLNVALYVACIQKGDIGAAELRTDKLFNMVITHFERWIPVIQNASPALKAVLQQLINNLLSERQKLAEHNETGTKPEYSDFLTRALKIFGA